MGLRQPQAMAATARDAEAKTRAQHLHTLLRVLHPALQLFTQRYVLRTESVTSDDESEKIQHDAFACLESIRDGWSEHFEPAGCDPQVLELATKLLVHHEHKSDAPYAEMLEALADLIGASEATMAQISAFSAEFEALSSNGASSGDETSGSSNETSEEGRADRRKDDEDSSEWEFVESSSSSTTSSSEPYATATEIQRRASAGCAVAQRFVAARELVEQAKSFFSASLDERAFESIRRAVTLWRRVNIDKAFLDELIGLAKDRVVEKDIRNSSLALDACFVFAICGDDSAEGDDDSDAEAFWRQCVDAHPAVAIFQFWLARRLYDCSSYDGALSFVEKALELEANPQWLYLRAQCLTKLPAFTLAERVDAFRLYITRNPPDEEHVPEAYYSFALLYLEEGEYVLAKRFQALAQLAERPPIRFPSFGLVDDGFHPKRMLRIAFSAPLHLLSIKEQLECVESSELECECCHEWQGMLSLLRHKMESCLHRHVGCLLCGASMKTDMLLQHQEQHHAPS